MDRAIAFYEGTLGLRVVTQSPDWTELDCAGAGIGLHGGATPGERHTGLSFTVVDIEATCAQAAAGGAQILSPPSHRPGEPMLAELRDPEGNYFMLSQDVVPESADG